MKTKSYLIILVIFFNFIPVLNAQITRSREEQAFTTAKGIYQDGLYKLAVDQLTDFLSKYPQLLHTSRNVRPLPLKRDTTKILIPKSEIICRGWVKTCFLLIKPSMFSFPCLIVNTRIVSNSTQLVKPYPWIISIFSIFPLLLYTSAFVNPYP